MGNQTGSRMTSYSETIEGLKKELEIYVTNMKAGTEWAEFERLYRALCTIEELAGTPKTTLEQLFSLMPRERARNAAEYREQFQPGVGRSSRDRRRHGDRKGIVSPVEESSVGKFGRRGAVSHRASSKF